MAKKQKLTRSNRAYVERFLEKVEARRAIPYDETDVERILMEMRSDDELTRANAVREICPCRMPWEIFERLRKAAKPLQKDPSPVVRANARHIEEDARMVANFERTMEAIREQEEVTPRQDKHGKR